MRENLVVFFTLNTVSVPLESFNLRGGARRRRARRLVGARARARGGRRWPPRQSAARHAGDGSGEVREREMLHAATRAHELQRESLGGDIRLHVAGGRHFSEEAQRLWAVRAIKRACRVVSESRRQRRAVGAAWGPGRSGGPGFFQRSHRHTHARAQLAYRRHGWLVQRAIASIVCVSPW